MAPIVRPLVFVLLSLTLVAGATARGHGGGGHGGGHGWGGGRPGWSGGQPGVRPAPRPPVVVHRGGGIWLGAPLLIGGAAFYGYGYPYAYPPAYATPIAPVSPSDLYYYCPSANAYYPQVAQCDQPWVPVQPQVAPTPPPAYVAPGS